jgi:hypothetical protein
MCPRQFGIFQNHWAHGRVAEFNTEKFEAQGPPTVLTLNNIVIRRAYIASDGFLSTIVASRAKVHQIRSSQLAIARPISSGVSSCTKWRPLTTTRC